MSANTDMTDIIQSKAHPYHVKRNILTRLEEIKKINSKAYDKYLENQDNETESLKDSFYHTHYLAFDELIHSVQWCVKMTETRP